MQQVMGLLPSKPREPIGLLVKDEVRLERYTRTSRIARLSTLSRSPPVRVAVISVKPPKLRMERLGPAHCIVSRSVTRMGPTAAIGRSGQVIPAFLVLGTRGFGCRTRANRAVHYQRGAVPARLSKAVANTIDPRAISSADANSSGRWLTPFRHGMKSIAVGAIREMNNESW